MAGTVLAACLLATLQDPTGAVGDLVWPPPAAADPLVYRVRLVKERRLDAPLSKAEHGARRLAGFHAPRSRAKQSVELDIDVRLTPAADAVRADYAVRLRRHALRWRLVEPESAGADVSAVVRPADVWGPPPVARTEPSVVRRDAIECSFEHGFARRPDGRVRLERVDGPLPEHLLPVLWESPLPCWVGHVVDVLDLPGVAVVEGKSLIRERIDRATLGPRTSRASLVFTRSGSGSFAMRYELRIDQRVDRTRDGGARNPVPFLWRLDVVGEATYSLRRHAFEEIDEDVAGYVVEPSEDKLARLYDEPFVGRIEARANTPRKPDRKRR